MLNAKRNIVIALSMTIALLWAPVLCGRAGEETILDGDASNLFYGILMASFGNRNLDNMESSIDGFVASTKPGDLNRIKAMMALAKLGKPQAEKALATLESWEGDYRIKEDEEFRKSCMADLYLYYLDEPEKAAELYQELIDGGDVRSPFLLSGLFQVYSGHARMFDLKKMEHQVEAMKKASSPHFVLSLLTLYAAGNEQDKAKEGIVQYEAAIPPEYQAAAKVYTAPIWGFLGDVDKVVGNLEPGLQEQAINYAPGGFRLYCDWIRQSPAYNSIRDDERFIEMWERLYAFEPEARGGTILIPPFGDKKNAGARFVPEPTKK